MLRNGPICRRLAGVVGAWVLAALVVTSAAAAPRPYEGPRQARVVASSSTDIQAIEEAGGIILNCIPAPGALDVVASPEQLARIAQLGLSCSVVHENVQELIDREREAGPRADSFDDFFLAYHPYDAGEVNIIWYMDELVTRYPGLVSRISIGTTLENRTIWGLRIANDTVPGMKPGVLYFSCAHAREWITTTVPTYFAAYLLGNYGSNPLITDMVDHTEIFLVPVSNVDGYIYTWTSERLWRKNRRLNANGSYGVDINRNWGEAWGIDNDGSSPYPSSGTYRGTGPFSEPETHALRDFFLNHANIRAQLDIHSYSQYILWPWGYTPDLCPDNAMYEDIGLAMRSLILAVHGKAYTAGPTYTTIYAVNGDSLDWTYAQRGILSYSFELRPAAGQSVPGFELPPDQIIPNNEEILPALVHLTSVPQVRSTQIAFPEGRPDPLLAGVDTPVRAAFTSATESLDANTATLHYRYHPDASFAAVSMSQVNGVLYEAVLPATNCSSSPEYYFSITGDSGTTTAPSDAPATAFTTEMLGSNVIFDEDLSEDPGWTIEDLWAWGTPTGGGGVHGGPDPTSGHTGSNVYGYNLAGDYTNSMPVRHLTTPPIDCTGHFGLRLSFWRWLGVEQPMYDHAKVSISTDQVTWVTLWENTSEVADTSWVRMDLDISSVADDQSTVYLRWTMGPTDSGWAYCGWNIDDVRIYGTGCVGIPGDYDGNRLVDLRDYAAFADCMTGPNGGTTPGCGVFDMDTDDDVDLDDAGQLFKAFTGS